MATYFGKNCETEQASETVKKCENFVENCQLCLVKGQCSSCQKHFYLYDSDKDGVFDRSRDHVEKVKQSLRQQEQHRADHGYVDNDMQNWQLSPGVNPTACDSSTVSVPV